MPATDRRLFSVAFALLALLACVVGMVRLAALSNPANAARASAFPLAFAAAGLAATYLGNRWLIWSSSGAMTTFLVLGLGLWSLGAPFAFAGLMLLASAVAGTIGAGRPKPLDAFLMFSIGATGFCALGVIFADWQSQEVRTATLSGYRRIDVPLPLRAATASFLALTLVVLSRYARRRFRRSGRSG